MDKTIEREFKIKCEYVENGECRRPCYQLKHNNIVMFEISETFLTYEEREELGLGIYCLHIYDDLAREIESLDFDNLDDAFKAAESTDF